MTKKEIYNQLLEVYKKTAKEFGEWPSVRFLPFRSQPEHIDSAFSNYKNGKCLQNPELDDNSLVICIKKLSKSEVENELVCTKVRYSKLLVQKKKDDFYATPNGALYKRLLESECDDLQKQVKETLEKSRQVVEKTIKYLLGERWGVFHFGEHSFEVALTNNEGNPIFGHSFTIYIDNPLFEKATIKNTYVDLNYGILGSFNVLEDADRRELLRGLYKFSSELDEVDNIRKYMFEVRQKLDYLYEIIDKKRKALDNPPV